MFNYKRLTFIFIFISIFLLVTETKMEHDIRKKLLSLFDIAVNESSQVSDTAPSSLIDTAENLRVSIKDYLSKEGAYVSEKADRDNSYLGIILEAAAYTILLFKYISSYIITFYPFVIFVMYLFFTSSFFGRKDDFPVFDDY